MMRIFHVHRDRHWYMDGIYALYHCRCGARRVRWVNRKMAGPVPVGFPALRDKHGRPVTDTGWVPATIREQGHNHVTREIRAPGKCPACDRIQHVPFEPDQSLIGYPEEGWRKS